MTDRINGYKPPHEKDPDGLIEWLLDAARDAASYAASLAASDAASVAAKDAAYAAEQEWQKERLAALLMQGHWSPVVKPSQEAA